MTAKATPEEQELDRKSSELAALADEVAERELELLTEQAALSEFEHRYVRAVGTLMAELDALQAEILEELSRRRPSDTTLDQQAREARSAAESSARAVEASPAHQKEDERPPGSESLKRLYHQVAKLIHPDLATDPASRPYREQLMKQANLAYEKRSEAELQRILDGWRGDPDAVVGEGVAFDLIRTIRRIAQLRRRLAEIEPTLRGLRASHMCRMKQQVEQAAVEGKDLLAALQQDLGRQVAEKRLELRRLRDGNGRAGTPGIDA